MNPEELLRQIHDDLSTYLDKNTIEFQKGTLVQLEDQLNQLIVSLKDNDPGQMMMMFLADLKKIADRINNAAQAFDDTVDLSIAEDFQKEINDRIYRFKKDMFDFTEVRGEVFADFESVINKITNNIKLDFEFLFDRYSRRVGLNIGSKFFELIELKNEYEIKSFILEDIFTCKRLKGDLIELSRTFDGQIVKFIEDLASKTIHDQYGKYFTSKSLKINKSGNSNFEELEKQCSVRSVFTENNDLTNEMLSKIVFSGVTEKKTIYEVLMDDNEQTKMTDHRIKKFMKLMENQLEEFTKLLTKEVEARIDEKVYPVSSFFSRTQDIVMETLFLPQNKTDLLQDELESLKKSMSADKSVSNYDVFKDLLA